MTNRLSRFMNDSDDRGCHMPLAKRRMILLGLGAAAIAGVAAYIAMPRALNGSLVFNVDGVAIRGADPVAYFTEAKQVFGSQEFEYVWKDVTWRFASAENRELFARNPERYAPQYGGFCAWAVAAKGKLFSTQPKNWAVVNGKLYLNYNDSVQDRWNADIDGFISKGDGRWPAIISEATKAG